jgi:hypothetical protein
MAQCETPNCFVRKHRKGIMEMESWKRNEAGGIVEESWKSIHGGETMKGNHGGPIMERELWRNHGDGIVEEQSLGILEA